MNNKSNIRRMSRFFLPLACAGMAVSCEQVDTLGNAADVTAVSVLQHEPSSVRLGTPTRIDDQTIVLPVLYGKYEFDEQRPLRLRLSVGVSKDVAKILAKEGGLFNPDEVTFGSIGEVVAFDVVAASGKVKRWYLRLLETILDEQTQIRGFDITGYAPAGAVIGREAIIRHSENEIGILALAPVFPLSVTPGITLAGMNARIEGYTPGDVLTFTSIDAAVTLPVKAESGKTQAWTVRLIQCRDAGEEPSLSLVTQTRLSLPADALSFELPQGGTVESVEPDFPSGMITLQTKGNTAPVVVKAHLPVHPAAQLVNGPADTTFHFTAFDETVDFYIVDAVSTFYKKWTLRLARWHSREADIKTFALTDVSSPIVLDPPEINPLNAAVTLKITGGAAHFPFTAHIAATLSEGAQLKDNQPLAFAQTFADMETAVPLTVVAENGGERTWNIRFLNADPASAAKRTGSDVTAFVMDSWSSEENPVTGSKVKLDPTAAIDAAAKNITVKITDWKKYFPLKLKAAITLSEGAVSDLDHAETLEFAAPDNAKSFTVTAENGSSTVWIIRFADEEPAKSNLAALTDFSVGDRLSADSRIDEIYIEPGRKQVVILLSHARFPLRITPVIAVSPKAHLLDINSNEEIIFSGFDDEKTIRLLPEDESSVVAYKIMLLNAPQLVNGTLDEWSDDKNAAGWDNPNATGVITASRLAPGYAGTGYAARLTSATATILGSIKVTASGSIFLGRFDYQIMYASKPKLMTWFGIPWQGRPIALEADYTYRPGARLVNSSHDPVDGTDEGSATVELLHWGGSGAIKYHSIAPDDAYGHAGNEAESPGITVTARAKNEHITATAGWRKLRLNLVTLDAAETPNYIHITFASSTRGDKQIGADGSTLILDNIRLIYYEPESGATTGSSSRR
ncbi:MAG: PCMD domain-containing protein [Prevotellaceae bacterium]|jgi:hypothetical protein|nr:PCMD domain-containing protein [Prevotellaceae bacterium]